MSPPPPDVLILTTRTARPEDLPALRALDPLAATDVARRDHLAESLTAAACFVATAAADDRPIGYATFHHRFFGHGLIELLVTHPAHRRQGIASALVAHCERHACQTPKLFTSTNRSNSPMRALLAKLGFTQTGTIDGLDEGDPELIYVKRLMTPPSQR